MEDKILLLKIETSGASPYRSVGSHLEDDGVTVNVDIMDVRNAIMDAAKAHGFKCIEATGSKCAFKDGDLELLQRLVADFLTQLEHNCTLTCEVNATVEKILDLGLGLEDSEEIGLRVKLDELIKEGKDVMDAYVGLEGLEDILLRKKLDRVIKDHDSSMTFMEEWIAA